MFTGGERPFRGERTPIARTIGIIIITSPVGRARREHSAGAVIIITATIIEAARK